MPDTVRNNRAPKVRSGTEILTGNLSRSRSRRINGDAVARQACPGILMESRARAGAASFRRSERKTGRRSKADATKAIVAGRKREEGAIIRGRGEARGRKRGKESDEESCVVKARTRRCLPRGCFSSPGFRSGLRCRVVAFRFASPAR